MYPPFDAPKPRPSIRPFIKNVVFSNGQSLSTGGREEKVNPVRLGTTKFNGISEDFKDSSKGKYSRNDPVAYSQPPSHNYAKINLWWLGGGGIK